MLGDGERALRTPLDVVRIAIAFRVTWPAVCSSVDIVDFVSLTLGPVKRPSLFEWLSKYCAESSQLELGAALDGDVAHDLEKRLRALAEASDGFESELRRLRWVFLEIGMPKSKPGKPQELELFPQCDEL